MLYLLISIIAYLIGSINFSILISKKFAGFDIREKGSGNAGTTNILRTIGKKAAVITLVLDILKGVIAIVIAVIFGKMFKCEHKEILVQLSAFFVAIGHTFPVFFGFKGGKGVATSLGILLIINWKLGLICLLFALFQMALTRMVSLGSISAAVLFPILALFINNGYIVKGNYFVFSLFLAGLVIFNHRANVKRIMDGTENRLSFKKKESTEEKK